MPNLGYTGEALLKTLSNLFLAPFSQPTLPGRSWLVSPFGANPWWLSVVAVLPALLLSILIFMDQQITAVILNRSEYQLQVSLVGSPPETTIPAGARRCPAFSPDHRLL